jgi:hypothetical protein
MNVNKLEYRNSASRFFDEIMQILQAYDVQFQCVCEFVQQRNWQSSVSNLVS